LINNGLKIIYYNMGYIDILEGCNNSVSGIKELLVLTKYSGETSIIYPMDVVFVSGATDTVPLEIDRNNRLIQINSVFYMYRNMEAKYASFDQEVIETRQGKVYRKTLSFAFPRLDLYNNNQLRDFLFDKQGDFALSQITVMIVDNNNESWIVGWDLPFVVDEFNAKTDMGGGDNSYALSYSCSSYLPALKYIVQ